MKVEERSNRRPAVREAIAMQQQLAARVEAVDAVPLSGIRLVAGADVSHGFRSDRFFAAVVVLSFPELETVEVKLVETRAEFPYVPGLLAFREGPAFIPAFEALENEPDVIIFDGHGVAHPRGLGIASHLGVTLDKPTVGCAKSVLVGDYREPGRKKGSRAPLVYETREVGAALRTRDGVKPVFVSVGHKISLESALTLVNRCAAKYRLPEPTRLAHVHSNAFRCGDSPEVRG